MHEELYEITDERLLKKTEEYLCSIREKVLCGDKKIALHLLDMSIFYIKFHLEVNKYLPHLDETGKELKDIWDNGHIGHI